MIANFLDVDFEDDLCFQKNMGKGRKVEARRRMESNIKYMAKSGARH
jgi:hypothetical protein